MGGLCAHCPDDVRTRGQECPGAEALALSTLRLTTLAKTQGGASQRPSVLAGPMFVCCCVGQAKVNGATNVSIFLVPPPSLAGFFNFSQVGRTIELVSVGRGRGRLRGM